MGCSKSSSKRKVTSRKLPKRKPYLQNQEKHQIDNLTLHPKQLEKEEQKKSPKLVEGEKIIKIRAERIAKEMKEPIAKINKTKTGS